MIQSDHAGMALLNTSKLNRKRTVSQDFDSNDNSSKYSLLHVADDEDDALKLNDLPSLIIRNIIKMEQESIEKIRLISPRWNTEAIDLLTHGKCLAGIEYFRWERTFHGMAFISISLAFKYRSFFGVENWRTSNLPTVVGSWGVTMIAHLNSWINDSTVNESRLFDHISRFFARCSRIDILHFKMSFFRQNGAEIEVVKDAMKGVMIKELCFTEILNFNDDKYNFLDIIRNNHVNSLTLSVFDITRMYFGNFFTDAVNLVPKIELKMDRGTPHFDLNRVLVPWNEAVKFLRKNDQIKARIVVDTLNDGSGLIRIHVAKRKEEDEEQQ